MKSSFHHQPVGVSASRMAPHLNDFELNSTHKSARFSEMAAYDSPQWMSQAVSADDSATTARHESEIFDASLRALNHRRRQDNTMPALKLVEFSVELPAARLVQLVADFTDWDEAPLNMMRFERGIWSTTVPLPPGIYAYRFLVDGELYEDPRAIRHDSDPERVGKAFVQVK